MLPAAYLLQEDDQIPLTLSASSDIDEPFFFQLISPPAHGRVLGDPPDLVYVPKADFHGDDALAFRVVQSGITSQKAVIQLTVESVNDVPEALPSEWVVEEDGSLLVEVSGRDLEEDTLTFQLVEGPSHGELEGTLPVVFYRPDENYFGEDAWSFRVFDGQDTSEAATVLVEVTPVADRPVGLPQVVELLENEAPLIELYGEDPDGDSLTFETVEAPAHGVLTGAPPLLDLCARVELQRHRPVQLSRQCRESCLRGV